MRRSLVLVLAMALVAVTMLTTSRQAVAQKRQRVDLPEGTVLDPGTKPVVTLDGQIGFVAPAVGDTVVAFAMRTGEILGRVSDLGAASGIALSENGPRRLLVVTLPNDPEGGTPSAVVVLDATDPREIAPVATFTLPATARLAPNARAEIARDQRVGVVPIVAPVSALLSFDPRNGQQVGALTLDGTPDRVSVVERTDDARLAVVCSDSSKVAVVSLSDNGVLLPVATFAPPEDAPVSSANNVAFDTAGRIGYVASLKGRALLSFSLDSGEMLDRIPTDGSSAAVAVYHAPDGDRLAVTNVSRPGAEAGEDVEPDADSPLGLPGAIVVDADQAGHLVEHSRFYPETGEELAPQNNPDFSADGSLLFVPARTGSLYLVDVETGQTRLREGLENRVQSIVAAPLADAVAVVAAGGSEGHVEILPASVPAVDAPPAETKPENTEQPKDHRDAKKTESDRRDGPPSIEKLAPSTIQAGRRRALTVTAVGANFVDGATVTVAGETSTTVVGKNGRRASFSVPASLLQSAGTIPVQIRNPDGTSSNTIAFEVVTPYAPLISKIAPGRIDSGSGGVDLKIRGDHFRDGAVATVTYVDSAGVTQTEALKTYRLSFTSIVARLPQRLTNRAKVYNVSVTDRDGVTESETSPVVVVGPSVSGVTPDRYVAGDTRKASDLVLHVKGLNMHRDALVYVRRPVRGAGDETAPYRLVASSSVRWKSAEKIIVKLSPSDVAYSGTLALRVINPVPGERRKNGDPADFAVAVAGPAIASASPDPILAGSDAFVLKLVGTDFRRGAIVKLIRNDGTGETTKRVVVDDDPNFKDRKRINVEMNTPELLRLVAHPGTLSVRILNPTTGKGDPSDLREIQIVGPSISQFALVPSENDPTKYRLNLTGQYFVEGSLVQILTGDGTPDGHPLEVRLKSPTELVVLIGRKRITDLRTFKVVVINPGGPYNHRGVFSDPIDVTVN